jgi:alanine racemase
MTATCMAAEFRAWATIDLHALRNNFVLAHARQPGASMVAVVKANAYGHGLLAVARALRDEMAAGDCFGVASLDEAMALRRGGLTQPILLLEGVLTWEELQLAVAHDCHLVVHASYQLELLQQLFMQSVPAQGLTIWLKVDTGMHRLGLAPGEFSAAWQCLHAHPGVHRLVVMSHFACADDPANPMTKRQFASLQETLALADLKPADCELSLAASATILQWPELHYQWLRPGIMLYGGSAILGENGVDRGLRPVMSLRSRLIACRDVAAGESIGYGATYTCGKNMRIGVISIGYGDGYPRHAPLGTPVLIRCRTGGRELQVRAPLCARVSMDLLVVDLSACHLAQPGDEVLLWGEGLPADEIARLSGTISYELFCQVTSRVHYVYI